METSKDQKSIETSEGLQDKVWTRLKIKVWKQVRDYKTKVLTRLKLAQRLLSAWFLEIALVHEVGMYTCVCACACVCVCVSPPHCPRGHK